VLAGSAFSFEADEKLLALNAKLFSLEERIFFGKVLAKDFVDLAGATAIPDHFSFFFCCFNDVGGRGEREFNYEKESKGYQESDRKFPHRVLLVSKLS
jgi:hypothetical protein